MPQKTNHRILFAEDEKADRLMTERYLKAKGVEFTAAFTETEEEFRHSLKEFHPTLIISDFLMTGFTGMQALKIAQHEAPDIPFILLTGSMNEDTAVECMKEGADDYVIKKNLKRLVPAIHSAIAKRANIAREAETEKALKESEQKYRYLFEHNPQPMWIYDLETLRFLEVNEAAISHYGYSREEFLSMTIKDIRPAEDIPLLEKNSKITYANLNSEGEWRHKKKCGEKIYVETVSHSLDFQGRKARHVLVNDITERKVAEKSLFYQSELQKILRKIASDFIRMPLKEFDKVINNSLREIGEFMQADRVFIFEYDWPNNVCNNTYEWRSERNSQRIDQVQGVSLDALPQWAETHKKGKTICIPDVLSLSENDKIRQVLEQRNIKSLIALPIMDDEECIGFLGFDSVQKHYQFSEMEESFLDVMAQLLTNIYQRSFVDEERVRLYHAIEQSPTSIIIADAEGIIEYVNPKTIEVTGYTKDELIGENPRIFSSGEKSTEEYEILWNDLLSGKEWTGEFHNKKKNGELYWEFATISPVLNEKKEIINYVAIKEDVSEKKRMEQIQKILVNIANVIVTSPNLKTFSEFIFSQITKVIHTKNFFISLYDEQSEKFSTVFMFDTLDMSIKDFPAKKTLSHYVIKQGKSQFIDKKKFNDLVDSGEVELMGLPAEVWIGVPVFEKDKPKGVLVIQSYKGEKRLTEEDMKLIEYAAPSLSLAIERKRAFEDLKEAKEKAEESDRLKTAFLANMSHEIRTPMNGIMGFATLLDDPQYQEEEKSSFIQNINQSGQRLLDTVNDLIDISKIEAGEVNLSIKETNIGEQMQNLYEFFLPEAQQKGLELLYHAHADNIIMPFDRTKLNSIMTNLIKNAIKYTHKGSVKFGYDKVKSEEGDQLQFYVKDTGIGIPKKRLKAIFNRFEQADIEDNRAFQGSGLGLAISKSYAELLGGKIWVESEEGKGSVFYFTQPIYNITEQKIKDKKNKIKPSLGSMPANLKVLIVDDEHTIAEYLSKILKNISRETLFAENGSQAVNMVSQHVDIDVILMDLKMPVMSGYEASRKIKTFAPHIPIIAQTAYALEGDRQKALNAGCDEYITKPVKKRQMLELIQNLLGPFND